MGGWGGGGGCLSFRMVLCVVCFGGTVLYVCIDYDIQVYMYHVSTQGIDERMINVHYYYYCYSLGSVFVFCCTRIKKCFVS